MINFVVTDVLSACLYFFVSSRSGNRDESYRRRYAPFPSPQTKTHFRTQHLVFKNQERNRKAKEKHSCNFEAIWFDLFASLGNMYKVFEPSVWNLQTTIF